MVSVTDRGMKRERTNVHCNVNCKYKYIHVHVHVYCTRIFKIEVLKCSLLEY